MNLLLVGTSHRLAPVEVRERVAVDADGAAALGARLAADGEAVCLSTCNRTELYVAGPGALAGVEPRQLEPHLYRLEHEAAAVHLFRVASGLDSLVPGESEILGQVRDAYERGTVVCALCRPRRRTPPEASRTVASAERGQTVRLRVRAAA